MEIIWIITHLIVWGCGIITGIYAVNKMDKK